MNVRSLNDTKATQIKAAIASYNPDLLALVEIKASLPLRAWAKTHTILKNLHNAHKAGVALLLSNSCHILRTNTEIEDLIVATIEKLGKTFIIAIAYIHDEAAKKERVTQILNMIHQEAFNYIKPTIILLGDLNIPQENRLIKILQSNEHIIASNKLKVWEDYDTPHEFKPKNTRKGINKNKQIVFSRLDYLITNSTPTVSLQYEPKITDKKILTFKIQNLNLYTITLTLIMHSEDDNDCSQSTFLTQNHQETAGSQDLSSGITQEMTEYSLSGLIEKNEFDISLNDENVHAILMEDDKDSTRMLLTERKPMIRFVPRSLAFNIEAQKQGQTYNTSFLNRTLDLNFNREVMDNLLEVLRGHVKQESLQAVLAQIKETIINAGMLPTIYSNGQKNLESERTFHTSENLLEFDRTFHPQNILEHSRSFQNSLESSVIFQPENILEPSGTFHSENILDHQELSQSKKGSRTNPIRSDQELQH